MSKVEDDDPRDFFVKAKPKSVRPMKMTDAARFDAMEAVIEATREFIRLVDEVNHRPRKEGIEMRAVGAQGVLRAALDALDATTDKGNEA